MPPENGLAISPAFRALRSHDVHQGLRKVNRHVGLVATELHTTQLVGMAAALGTTVKGQEVVKDAKALKQYAAEQLDITPWAFDGVVNLLDELGFVRRVQRDGAGEITDFFETVPAEFDTLYGNLGEVWAIRTHTEIETSLLEVVNDLSYGPRPVSQLQIDAGVVDRVVSIGRAAMAIETVDLPDGAIAYSPYFAYERPAEVGELLGMLDIDEIRASVEEVRRYQGLPISIGPHSRTLTDLVAGGLIAGPAVELPDGRTESFAVAPYGVAPQLLTVGKALLDKALALIAAVRAGEHFGGATNLRDPVRLLQVLADPTYTIRPHSSARRQYAVLAQRGIVQFHKSGSWYGVQLIDSADNIAAVQLAIELASQGEAIGSKELPYGGGQVLLTEGKYLSPIQAIPAVREGSPLAGRMVERLLRVAMGYEPID